MDHVRMKQINNRSSLVFLEPGNIFKVQNAPCSWSLDIFLVTFLTNIIHHHPTSCPPNDYSSATQSP